MQNLDRLDENVKEDSDGVHNTLGLYGSCSQIDTFNLDVKFVNGVNKFGGTRQSVTAVLSSRKSETFQSVILLTTYNDMLVLFHLTDKVLLLGIIENMTELRTAVCQAAGEQGMLGWLLRRLKVMGPLQPTVTWYRPRDAGEQEA